jgi:enamine deaminase RidA (YjgF/YER057c/UK114 family)
MIAVDQLAERGFSVSTPPSPLGAYVRAVRTGNLVFTACHGPLDAEGRTAMRGQAGSELTLEEGMETARLCAVACLSSLRGEIGDLERVRRVVKMLAFVNGAPGFDSTSQVIDGASDLLLHAFGERGVHARAAIGISELPGGIPVEIELIVDCE